MLSFSHRSGVDDRRETHLALLKLTQTSLESERNTASTTTEVAQELGLAVLDILQVLLHINVLVEWEAAVLSFGWVTLGRRGRRIGELIGK